MASAAAINPESDLDAFRTQVREWLDAHFPESLKGNDNMMSSVEGPTEESADEKAWREAMRQKRRDIDEMMNELDLAEENCLGRLAEIGVGT